MDEKLILQLKLLFNYDKNSGKVIYKKREIKHPEFYFKGWNTKYAGKEAGYISNGYIRILVNKKFLYAHQIAFAIVLGYIPNEIDHIDRNKLNNKWKNLREVKHYQNGSNCNKRITNKSGFKGVSWSKSSNCWRMDIQYKGNKYFSLHKTKEEAYEKYCQMSLKLHKEFGNV